jgi:4-hydroxyacetophenone monooxygenase
MNEASLISSAIDAADMNALRMTLYQLTGDPKLVDMSLERKQLGGFPLVGDTLAEKYHAYVRNSAIDYLSRNHQSVPPPPTLKESRALIEHFNCAQIPDDMLQLSYEELAFDEFPRDVKWTSKPQPETLAKHRVVIVGCGISGISAAIMLKRLGISFVVIEKESALGGTWQRNDYPESRVDIASYNYQFKFEKNYPWPDYFATRQSSLDYLNHVARKHGILEHIRFSSEVLSSIWNQKENLWEVVVLGPDGKKYSEDCRYLFTAVGVFNKPSIPDFEGIASFKGSIFHSTEWNHELSLKDSRVAIIGSGSTGVQVMSHIASVANHLFVVQRTPQWMFPIPGYKDSVPKAEHWLFDNLPYYWNWVSYSAFVAATKGEVLTEIDREWQNNGGLVSERNDKLREVLAAHIQKTFSDRPDLVLKLMPKFAPMARRPVVDNGWYEALKRPNVELVAEGIERINSQGIRTLSGQQLDVDVIVLATGFEVSRFLWPLEVEGRDGARLEDVWRDKGARAYLGISVPKMPNLFLFYGPNSQSRAGGLYSWIEIWTRYACQLVVENIEAGRNAIEIKPDVFEDYNERLDREAAATSLRFQDGKGSYHVNSHGRLIINIPWKAAEFFNYLYRPDIKDYLVL